MAKWSLEHIINHHKGIEALDPMFLHLPGVDSYVHGKTRLGLACCKALEESGMPLTVESLKEAIMLNDKKEYQLFKQIPVYPIKSIKLPLPSEEPMKADDLGVTVENGKVVVSSLNVAKVFEKEHKNVLRDIETLDCSGDFNRLNFERVTYADKKGEKRPAYKMTRDGFTFLVMGYTGKKAAMFKEAYIKRFNGMEKALTNPVNPPALPQKLYTPEEAAEELMVSGYRKFYMLMIKHGFFVKIDERMYLPKPEYVRQGLFDFINRKRHGHKRPLVTQSGIEYLKARMA